MIYAGTDLKFKIIPMSEVLDLEEQYFEIVLKNRWGKVMGTVEKDDCFVDEDGNYYFVIENVQPYVYYAYFASSIDDEDYIKQERVMTDMQELCKVDVRGCDCGCTNFASSSCHCEHIVRYEQVWTVNVDGTPYLVGSDGAYILTSDGKRIPFKIA